MDDRRSPAPKASPDGGDRAFDARRRVRGSRELHGECARQSHLRPCRRRLPLRVRHLHPDNANSGSSQRHRWPVRSEWRLNRRPLFRPSLSPPTEPGSYAVYADRSGAMGLSSLYAPSQTLAGTRSRSSLTAAASFALDAAASRTTDVRRARRHRRLARVQSRRPIRRLGPMATPTTPGPNPSGSVTFATGIVTLTNEPSSNFVKAATVRRRTRARCDFERRDHAHDD